MTLASCSDKELGKNKVHRGFFFFNSSSHRCILIDLPLSCSTLVSLRRRPRSPRPTASSGLPLFSSSPVSPILGVVACTSSHHTLITSSRFSLVFFSEPLSLRLDVGFIFDHKSLQTSSALPPPLPPSLVSPTRPTSRCRLLSRPVPRTTSSGSRIGLCLPV